MIGALQLELGRKAIPAAYGTERTAYVFPDCTQLSFSGFGLGSGFGSGFGLGSGFGSGSGQMILGNFFLMSSQIGSTVWQLCNAKIEMQKTIRFRFIFLPHFC